MLIDLVKDTDHEEKKIFDAIKSSGAKIVLFGAGEMSRYTLTYLYQNDIAVECLCDNNKEKYNTMYMGLPIFDYEHMRKDLNGQKYHIIISTGPQYVDEIRIGLQQAGEKNKIFYLKGYEIVGDKIDYQYFKKNMDKFNLSFSLFEDEFSKKVFVNVLNAKLTGDFSLYGKIKSDDEYFDPNLVSLNDDEIFLNVGPYKGNDIIEFVKKTNGKFRKIIAIEPDENMLFILKNRLHQHKIDNFEIHNKGAWHEQGTLTFNGDLSGSSRFDYGNSNKIGNVTVDRIDNILDGNEITYIQMDIEGAEHNAIIGAEKTIKKYKPTMAISIYHRREDLFDLPLLINTFVPEYKFFLRHYTDMQTETVLYCIHA